MIEKFINAAKMGWDKKGDYMHRMLKVLNSNVVSTSFGAYLGYVLMKSYRDQEIKNLTDALKESKEDQAKALDQASKMNTEVLQLTSQLQIMTSQAQITSSRLADCRHDLHSSWCFWRQHTSSNAPQPHQENIKNVPSHP